MMVARVQPAHRHKQRNTRTHVSEFKPRSLLSATTGGSTRTLAQYNLCDCGSLTYTTLSEQLRQAPPGKFSPMQRHSLPPTVIASTYAFCVKDKTPWTCTLFLNSNEILEWSSGTFSRRLGWRPGLPLRHQPQPDTSLRWMHVVDTGHDASRLLWRQHRLPRLVFGRRRDAPGDVGRHAPPLHACRRASH